MRNIERKETDPRGVKNSRLDLIDSKSFELRAGQSLGSCHNWRGEKLFKSELKDRGRRFKIENALKQIWCYLWVSVLLEDDKRYFIIIPKGFDLLGWDILDITQQLREITLDGVDIKFWGRKQLQVRKFGKVFPSKNSVSYVNAAKKLAKIIFGGLNQALLGK
ncbi:hypothetical protein CK203_114832 [Vitis vinifera]|uniref:Uncharacterized protein n=1 Tax=Vitis vinifera TaxID=29760 RepID=A0A438BNX7_VITVI|nr:hypothetical protein CK203_114832 [Vitis vinifera]